MQIRPRETVILATDFDALIRWYQEGLGFRITKRFDDGFHYCNMETSTGIKIGIALASEMGMTPIDRASNSVVLQFEVDDVRAFCTAIDARGGTINNAPAFNEKDGFWFAGFLDPEGNPFWVVDKQCP